MKTFLKVAACSLLWLSFSHATLAQTATPRSKPHQWWNERYPGAPLKSPDAKKLPLISVHGNRFVDPQGTPLLFRGLSIADPDKIEGEGHWNKELFVKVQQTGARLVRIPVHPIAWRERTPQAYLTLLDQAVEWCTDLGMYVDIDWHSIGNLKAGLFQDPMYQTSMPETFNFWRTISSHFAGNNTVAFYELFNEPTSFSNKLGRVSWHDWKQINEDLIALIRAYDPEKIPLVAGFDWAYDLTPLRDDPIEAEGIGYVTHPYPMKRPKPWEPKWEEDFGFAADRYPLIATEIGFWERPGRPDSDYGPAIVKYLESRGISWLAWVFDPDWKPSMISSWETFSLTGEGEFFAHAMQTGGH
jgi:endoglucanase